MTFASARELADKLISETGNPLSNVHSWQQCHDYFGREEARFDSDQAALRLGFYLASWGMYRGSANIRNFDYRALEPIVDYVRTERVRGLRDLSIKSALQKSDQLQALIAKVREKISSIKATKLSGRITATDTLTTKIILGTVGCLPAYDRFFILGAEVREWGAKFTKDGRATLLSKLSGDSEFDDFCGYVRATHIHLPDMRLADAYLNYLGAWKEQQVKQTKAKAKAT